MSITVRLKYSTMFYKTRTKVHLARYYRGKIPKETIERFIKISIIAGRNPKFTAMSVLTRHYLDGFDRLTFEQFVTSEGRAALIMGLMIELESYRAMKPYDTERINRLKAAINSQRLHAHMYF